MQSQIFRPKSVLFGISTQPQQNHLLSAQHQRLEPPIPALPISSRPGGFRSANPLPRLHFRVHPQLPFSNRRRRVRLSRRKTSS
ncbi:hypothetical protein COP1_045827 [Malus domestica]